MGTRYWFRPKSFGYGATPVAWQGWVWTLGTALLTAAAIVTALLAEMRHWPHRRPLQVICAIVMVVAISGLVVVARTKTEGDWRWQP